MTTRRRTLAAAALCLLLVCSLLATGCSFSLPFGSADITFKNSTGNVVYSIYISPQTATTWGDPVYRDELRNGGSAKFDFDDIDGYGPGVYDVAAIDEYGLNVTLPAIRGTLLFALIELTIGGFNVFTSIKMITGGKPAHQTDTLLTWMYYKAFSTGKFGYAAALSFVMALSLGLLAIVQFRMMRNTDA